MGIGIDTEVEFLLNLDVRFLPLFFFRILGLMWNLIAWK